MEHREPGVSSEALIEGSVQLASLLFNREAAVLTTEPKVVHGATISAWREANLLAIVYNSQAFPTASVPRGIDWDMVVFKGLTIKGIYGREIFETWYKGSMMVQSGLPLEKIITHRFSYEDFQEGFDVMRSGNSGKVILNWV